MAIARRKTTKVRRTLKGRTVTGARKTLKARKTTGARKTLKVKSGSVSRTRKPVSAKSAGVKRKTVKAGSVAAKRKTLKAKRPVSTSRAHFEGDIKTVWVKAKSKSGPGIQMKLIEDFVFVDKSGTKWAAPKGRIIDGKNIPEPLRNDYFGTSFASGYGRALMIHNIACRDKKKSPQKVHKMLYDAMLIDGVPKDKAEFMYHALLNDGPKWKTNQRGSRVRR